MRRDVTIRAPAAVAATRLDPTQHDDRVGSVEVVEVAGVDEDATDDTSGTSGTSGGNAWR